MVEIILSIIFGGGIIGLRLYNFIIWKLIKNDQSMVKAKLVDRFYVYRGSRYGQRGCVVEYTINNKEYRTKLIVTKEAPLYNGTTGNEYDVYVFNKHPKIIVGSIDKNFSIWGWSIFFILFGSFIILMGI